MRKVPIFSLLWVLLMAPSASNAMDASAALAFLKTIPPVRVSMLHREGRNLVFAVSHPYLSCSPATFRQGDGGVQVIAPEKAGAKCKKPLLSSVLRIPVTDREIVEGRIAILLPASWADKSQMKRWVFPLRDANFDPFERERVQIINRRH